MIRLILLSVCIVIGVGTVVGLAMVAKKQQKLLREYETVKEKFKMTDAEVADFAKHWPEYFEAIKRQDEIAAVVAFYALVKLEQGDTQNAKRCLETTISTYYRTHRHDGNTNLLRNVETFTATNSALSNAIYGKLE